MPNLDGIDVSHHQAQIDWAAVAKATPNVRFVMSRVSHGGRGDHNLRTDREAERNRDGMRAAFPDTPRGYYHFLGMGTPKLQAEYFHQQVGDLQPNEFVMLDVEEDHAAKVPVLPVDHIVDTLEEIEDEFGRLPCLYIGRWYPGSLDVRLHRFPLMLPAYISEARFRPLAAAMGRPTAIWQWGGDSNGAKISGISTGRVDSNVILDDELFASLLGPAKIEVDEFGLLPELELNDKGNAVYILQALLIEHGVFRDLERNRDGDFGGGTERGVKTFQGQSGLPETGVVSRSTWRALGIAPRVLRRRKRRRK